MSDDGIYNPGANSVSGRQGLRGDLAGALYPSFSMSFDQVVSGMNLISDDAFGTANAPAGANLITDATALAMRYQPYRNNEAPPATRNAEVQRYVDFSHTDNLVFMPDAMEIRATLPAGMPAGQTTTTISGAVNASRTVTVADASAIRAGQVVSLVGSAQDDQVCLARAHGIRFAPVAGEIYNLSVAFNAPYAPVTLSVTADGASTTQTLSQALVDQFNATTSLTSLGLYAYHDPNDPGALCIIVPQWVSPADQFGYLARGSLQWAVTTASKIGAGPAIFENRPSIIATYVLSKSGNTLTLNHPITAANGALLNITPSVAVMRTNDYVSGGQLTIPIADTTPFAVGQYVWFGSETSLRFVRSKTANSLTFINSVFVTNGTFLMPVAAWGEAVTAAVTLGNVLSFTTVPAGVQVGQQAARFGANSNANLKVTAINRASTPQTVTLDGPITVASGNQMIFYQPIESVECWTKNGIAPGVGGKTWVAMELIAVWQGIGSIAAWLAYWLFRDSTQPTGLPAASGQNEIDMSDTFNYSAISNSTTYRPAAGPDPSTIIYQHPAWAGSYLPGNDMGRGTRKVQLVWSTNRVYCYIDGVLMLVRDYTYNNQYYAQIAFNAAVGSLSTAFNQNGFFPLDWSRFPMKFRIMRHRVWSAPDATPIAL